MDSESQSPLLAGERRLVSTTAKKIILASLILTACAALSVATISFAVKPSESESPHFFPSHSSSSEHDFASPLKKLKKPVVLMISTDGFSFQYKSKNEIPNIRKLIEGGTEADEGLIPVFPSETFPNHYSIATGLYPANHGIINNEFIDENGDKFIKTDTSIKWWLGEPLWETVSKRQGYKAATYGWPGTEVERQHWKCPEADCIKHSTGLSFEQKVDHVLNYFKKSCDATACGDDIPVLFNLYFDEPDKMGHRKGPDSDEVTKAVTRIDNTIGKLVDGLKEIGVYEDVNIILLGDHGMINEDDTDRGILLDEILEQTDIKKLPEGWVAMKKFLPLLGIQTPKGTSSEDIEDVVSQMNRALKSSKVKNGDRLTVCTKEKLPYRLHYSFGHAAGRIPSIVGLVDIQYVVLVDALAEKRKGGTHGYDNKFDEMRSIFIGHGPRFRKGHKVASFENIQIYNLVTAILGIEGVDNQGTMSFKETVLLPLPPAPAPAAFF